MRVLCVCVHVSYKCKCVYTSAWCLVAESIYFRVKADEMSRCVSFQLSVVFGQGRDTKDNNVFVYVYACVTVCGRGCSHCLEDECDIS